MSRTLHSYTDADIKFIKDERKKGTTFEEIALHIGISKKACQGYFYNHIKKSQSRKKVGRLQSVKNKRKFKYEKLSPMNVPISSTIIEQHRPMIALVGTPDEVCHTLKTMFANN